MTIVDCQISADLKVHLESETHICATTPPASLSLNELGISHVRIEDAIPTQELLAIHAQILELKQALENVFKQSKVGVLLPDPFQVHDLDLTILLYSVLSKIQEFNCLFETATSSASGFRVRLFTDRKDARTPHYPLQESEQLYRWILRELALFNGFELQEIVIDSVREPLDETLKGSSLNPHLSRYLRFRQNLMLRTRLHRLHNLWNRILSFRCQTVVLGWRNYQAAHLPGSLIHRLGFRWEEPDDIDRVHPQTDKRLLAGTAAVQNLLEATIRQILTQVLKDECRRDQYAVLVQMVEPFVSYLGGYAARCATLEAYLEEKRPAGYFSSTLSGADVERLTALLCRKEKIPVVGLQHGGSYGDLDERLAAKGLVFYLDELRLCDAFVAWGAGTADALTRAQKQARLSFPAVVLPGSAVSILPPKKRKVKTKKIWQPGSSLLYIAHAVYVNVVNKAWLKSSYAEHVFSMCDLLAGAADRFQMTVKLFPADDPWQNFMHQKLRAAYPNLTFIRNERPIAKLTNQAELIVLDIPSTTLCEILPLPAHIATVELLNDIYSKEVLVKPEALELLRKRCMVAPTYLHLREIVRRCLYGPEQVEWADRDNHEYFYRYVWNPDDQNGHEAYCVALEQFTKKQSTDRV